MSTPNQIATIRRRGVTVIEVLTSMVVAAIGVFGVMILIPFSVQQAQVGLDSDAATVVAENAYEDLKIYGFTQVGDAGNLNLRGTRVNVHTTSNQTLAPVFPAPYGTTHLGEGSAGARVQQGIYGLPLNIVPGSANAVAGPQGAVLTPAVSSPALIHLDPLAVSAVGFPVAAGAPSPDFLTGLLPPRTGTFTAHEDLDALDRTLNPLRAVVATGISNTTFVTTTATGPVTVSELLSREEINRIFRTEDDLVVGQSDFQGGEAGELELAQPVFDVSSQGNLVKRQVNGRISWSAILVPIKDPSRALAGTIATQYKVYILVYKDRLLIPGDPESAMVSAPVLRHSSITDPASVPNSHGGYQSAVNHIALQPDIAVDGVFKDDWVMLINNRPPADAAVGGAALSAPVAVFDPAINGTVAKRLAADALGYRTQVSFAKVISVDNTTLTGDSSILTVNGGPFDFYYSNVAGIPLSPANAQYTSATYVIHLKNVINVFERTITLEKESAWN